MYTQKPMADPTDWYAHCGGAHWGGAHWGTNYQWYAKCYVRRRRVKYSIVDLNKYWMLFNIKYC